LPHGIALLFLAIAGGSRWVADFESEGPVRMRPTSPECSAWIRGRLLVWTVQVMAAAMSGAAGGSAQSCIAAAEEVGLAHKLFADPPADIVAAVRPGGRGSHWVDETIKSKGIICYGDAVILDAGANRSPSYGLLTASTLAHTLALGEAAEMLTAQIATEATTAISRVDGEEKKATTIIARTIAEACFLSARLVDYDVVEDHVRLALWVGPEPAVPIIGRIDTKKLAEKYVGYVLTSGLLVRSQSLVVCAPSGELFLVGVGIGPEDAETTSIDADGELIRRGGEVDASRVARDNCDYAIAAAKSGAMISLNTTYCTRQEATRIRDAAGRLNRAIERERSYAYRLSESLSSDGVRGPRDNAQTAEQRDPNRKIIVHVEVLPLKP
jgi:hypothetical protein